MVGLIVWVHSATKLVLKICVISISINVVKCAGWWKFHTFNYLCLALNYGIREGLRSDHQCIRSLFLWDRFKKSQFEFWNGPWRVLIMSLSMLRSWDFCKYVNISWKLNRSWKVLNTHLFIERNMPFSFSMRIDKERSWWSVLERVWKCFSLS